MDNVDRLDLAKDMLCQEIMAATSPFDLAKRLWDTGNVECHNHRLSEISGMMPVLVVFERLSDGELYYKRLDPNNGQEWSHWKGHLVIGWAQKKSKRALLSLRRKNWL